MEEWIGRRIMNENHSVVWGIRSAIAICKLVDADTFFVVVNMVIVFAGPRGDCFDFVQEVASEANA